MAGREPPSHAKPHHGVTSLLPAPSVKRGGTKQSRANTDNR